MNIVILMGRLVADPEMRITPNGTPVATFSAAVDRGKKNTSGEKETDFFPCVVWRESANFACKYFHKGDGISIEGKLQTRSYEDKSGVKRYVTEVIVNKMEFPLGRKSDNSVDPTTSPYTPQQAPTTNPTANSFPSNQYSDSTMGDFTVVPSNEDDLPF